MFYGVRAGNPTIRESNNWFEWVAVITLTTCVSCICLNGTIREDNWDVKPPLHPNCKCFVKKLLSILAGTLTNLGTNGVDWHIKHKKRLPDYYISKSDAYKKGWKRKGKTLDKVLPGFMIGGDIYYNYDGKLPQTPSREWYEADFGYIYGYRSDNRLLYSNDGLIFATFDHYNTFYEIR